MSESISELKVMQSAAGFYVGHGYNDMGSTDFPFPYSRESDYFPTAQAAQKYLDFLHKLEGEECT